MIRTTTQRSHRYAAQDVVRNKACILRSVTTPSGLTASVWERRGGGKIAFSPDHHTFSLYLTGGHQVRPIEGSRKIDASGSPGAICVMPKHHDTAWDNQGYVRVVHLYFRDDHLEQATDGQITSLRPTTFARDELSQALMERYVLALDWTDQANTMTLDHALHALLAGFTRRGDSPLGGEPTGGLTPAQLSTVTEFVDTYLAKPISLAQLASLVGLSVRQFSRAFRRSRGMPPYEWVLSRRISEAQARLARGEPAIDVALACGFSSQSHMVRQFTARLGSPPSKLVDARPNRPNEAGTS